MAKREKIEDKISLIIVAKLDSEEQRTMLKNCYESAIYHTKTDLEVIVVYDSDYSIPNLNASLIDKKVKQPKPFNYNAALNAGAKVSTGNFLYFANSDLIFNAGALDELILQMKRHNLGSASAICPKAHKDSNKQGVIIRYEVGKCFTGWGFMLQKNVYLTIGGLPIKTWFYCADNETVEVLKQWKVLHGLVKSAEIEHIGQQTQKDLDSKTYMSYCIDSVKKFNKEYNKNIFNLNNK